MCHFGQRESAAATFQLLPEFRFQTRDLRDKGPSKLTGWRGLNASGELLCDIAIPDGLFEREILVNCGRSMLRRFQLPGQTLEREVVADRLLLTY